MLQTENLRIAEFSPLMGPRQLEAELAITDEIGRLVQDTRQALSAMMHGQEERRLVVVVGPCSIHDPEAALDYARRLKPIADATSKQLLVVMRTYFEKPRTVVGWKGLINDPHLDGSYDIAAGLTMARQVLLGVSRIGLPCATEFLDTVVPHYLSDMVSWAAIGARTTESQVHRQMASGLSMPVGFKNSTDGSLQNAVNAVLSARHAHAFLGINAEGVSSVVKTTGNPDGHIVLRGGASGPNYQAQDIAAAAEILKPHHLRPRGPWWIARTTTRARITPARPQFSTMSCALSWRGRRPSWASCWKATSGPANRRGRRACLPRTASPSPTPASAGTKPNVYCSQPLRSCEPNLDGNPQRVSPKGLRPYTTTSLLSRTLRARPR